VFPGRTPPEWPAVSALLKGRGVEVQMRMIDGELAFPDEEPPAGWREVRVGHGGAMVTVRRQADRVALVIWGNADEAMRRLAAYLAWGFASAGDGKVMTDAGELDAEAYGASTGISS